MLLLVSASAREQTREPLREPPANDRTGRSQRQHADRREYEKEATIEHSLHYRMLYKHTG